MVTAHRSTLGLLTSLGQQINTDLLLQLERIALVINRERLLRIAKTGNSEAKHGLQKISTPPKLPENCELHFNCDHHA